MTAVRLDDPKLQWRNCSGCGGEPHSMDGERSRFIQDAMLAFQFAGRSLDCRIDGWEGLQRAFANALPGSPRDDPDLADAIVWFSHSCITSMLLAGAAWYEVVWSDHHQAIALIEVGKSWRTCPRRHSGSRVVEARLPPPLRRRISIGLAHLAELDRAFDEVMKRTMDGRYREAQSLRSAWEARFLRVAPAMGWDARSRFAADMTNPEAVLLFLRFALMKAAFRASVLGVLQKALDLLAMDRGETASIVVEGVPTVESIRSMITDIETGGRPDRQWGAIIAQVA